MRGNKSFARDLLASQRRSPLLRVTYCALALALVTILGSCSAEDNASAGAGPTTSSPQEIKHDTPDGSTTASQSEPERSESDPPQSAVNGASEPSQGPNQEASEQTAADDVEAEQAAPATAEPEVTMAPPGFSDPSLTLEEDAFDGPNLSLQAVVLEDADPVRILLYLDGQGFPGWQTQYVDAADSPVGSEGGSVLRLVLRGVNPDGVGADAFPKSDVLTIESGEPDDGDLTVYLGTDRAPVPYRVHLQHSPLRLEVDLAFGD